MRKITKKLIKETLADCNEWNFAYDFKESQALVLFGGERSDEKIVNALASQGLVVLEYRPRKSPQTGRMKIGIASSNGPQGPGEIPAVTSETLEPAGD